MTYEQEVGLLKKEWKEAGWTDEEIESSLVSYFQDSPTFVDDVE